MKMKVLQLLPIVFLAFAYATTFATSTTTTQTSSSPSSSSSSSLLQKRQAEVVGATFVSSSEERQREQEHSPQMLTFGGAHNRSHKNSLDSAATTGKRQRVRTRRPSSDEGEMFDAPSPVQRVTQYKVSIVNKTQATSASSSSSSSSSSEERQHGKRNRNDSNANATRRSNSNKIGSNSSKRAPQTQRRRLVAPPPTTTTTTTTSTTSTTTTTSRPTLFGNLQFGNPFEIFSPNFWNLSNAPSQQSTSAPPTTTKRPPKKYIPSPPPPALARAAAKEEKLTYQKPKVTKPLPSVIPSISPPPKNNADSDGPFRIALPTVNLFAMPTPKKPETANDKEKRATLATLRERFDCPRESEVRFQLFPKICKFDKDCSVWNRDELCCEIFGAKSCVSGIPKPLEESSHAPILGLIPRKCPTRPLAELWWDVQECETDMDCWPRLCCPDGRRRYCRTSQPELEIAPVPVKRSFNYLTEYLECTPPPPPIFDLHPKACTSTFDCFPNVCCQEAGLRHCRPPKKSVLTLMANFLNVDFVKRLTQNIVIK